MIKKPLMGKNLLDFIQQAPEKTGMTILPDKSFVDPASGGVALAKASQATLALAFQFSSFGEYFNRRHCEVEESDSVAMQREYRDEFQHLAEPAARALQNLLGVQMRLDLASAGIDYAKYPGVGLNANLEIVGYEDPPTSGSEFLQELVRRASRQ